MESSPVLNQSRGFTLIEMIVVLAIIALLSLLVILSQSTFNRSLLLTDTAYGIALSAREAQTFGVSSRKFGSVQNAGYGLHFDMATPKSYKVFADTDNQIGQIPAACPLGTVGRPDRKPGDCRYRASSDGLLNTYTFTRGFSVKSICIRGDSGTLCSTDSNALQNLDFVFTRPNTSTTISATFNSGFYPSMSVYSTQITISDVTGQSTRNICISNLGQIVVSQNACL